jgi:5'-deoxynucleotidase YfbR-like HD superfamily hydrolase
VPETFSRNYLDRIPVHTLAQFEIALSTVERWQDEYSSLYTAKNTVLEHVLEMLVSVNEMERDCPNLAQVVDLEVLRLMIILHDSGETLRGDVPASEHVKATQNDRKMRKQLELSWTLRLIRTIPDPQTRKKFSDIARRENNRAQDDLEAHLCKFFDSVSDLEFGAAHVFDARRALHLGYFGTGSSRDPITYKVQCANVMRLLEGNVPAKHDFATFTEQHMFSVLVDIGTPAQIMYDLLQSVRM